MEFTIVPLEVDRDAEVLQRWVTHPRSRYWGMSSATVDDVRTAYSGIAAADHHEAFLGLRDGEPMFLTERYDPAHDPVGRTYRPMPGDIGMHVLVAPPDEPIAGLTTAVFRTIMTFLFADPTVRRVVVEPDVRNDKILRLNERMGFRRERIVDLPDKQAWLSFCTRRQHDDALRLLDGIHT